MIWFKITSDNKIIFYSPKVEMGQGTYTGLAQIAADELDSVFEEFRQIGGSGRDQAGTGLGLAIARRLAVVGVELPIGRTSGWTLKRKSRSGW